MNNKKFNELSEDAKRERLKAIISLVAPKLLIKSDWLWDIPIESQMKVLLANKHDLMSKARSYKKSYKNYQECLWVVGDGVPGTEKHDPLFHPYENNIVYISQTNLEHPIAPVKDFNTLLIYLAGE